MLFLEAKHFLCDHNLNYTDKMGMAAGVEVRVPFLDPDRGICGRPAAGLTSMAVKASGFSNAPWRTSCRTK
jgi:hypothetical protein